MIPIQNLYYLLLYAWNSLDEAEILAINPEPETHILDLLGAVLDRGIDHVLRRGLERNYLPQREVIPGIRGKLDLTASIKGNHFSRASAVCDYDEYSHDVLHNRILKATLRRLLQAHRLDPRLRDSIRATYHRLHDISNIDLSLRQFRLVRLHRNNRIYHFLLDVCLLVHHCLIPDKSTGHMLFRDFVRNEKRMSRLFERFVRNFYKREQQAFSVEAESMKWEQTTGTPTDLGFLPRMLTDVTLRRPGRTLIIDAKYYREPLQQHHGGWTIRSSHLYQICSYLRNYVARGQAVEEIDGLLLYPHSSRVLNLTFNIQGQNVRVCTINLNQTWQMIHDDLLALLPTSL